MDRETWIPVPAACRIVLHVLSCPAGGDSGQIVPVRFELGDNYSCRLCRNVGFFGIHGSGHCLNSGTPLALVGSDLIGTTNSKLSLFVDGRGLAVVRCRLPKEAFQVLLEGHARQRRLGLHMIEDFFGQQYMQDPVDWDSLLVGWLCHSTPIR